MLNDVVASLMAIEIKKEKGIDITASDIELLYFIGEKQPIERDELIKQVHLPPDVIDFILDRLEKNNLAEPRSPWRLTKIGEETLVYIKENRNKILEIIRNDSFLSDLYRNAKSILD